MKKKVTVLIVLALIIGVLFVIKGMQDQGTEKYPANVTDSESSSISAGSAASLLKEAKQQGIPAWLLFHSTT